jgi:hypothetical protein
MQCGKGYEDDSTESGEVKEQVTAAPCRETGTSASVAIELPPPSPQLSLRHQRRGAHSGIPSWEA